MTDARVANPDQTRFVRRKIKVLLNFEPFYSFRHGRDQQDAFRLANRRPSFRPHDEGTEVQRESHCHCHNGAVRISGTSGSGW
jgi:hypothetical protein